MASFDFPSIMDEIANFRANDCKKCIGHLYKLKIGGKELKQDFKFRNPMKPTELVPMAATITYFHWDTTEGAPVIIVGRVTGNNHAIITNAVTSPQITEDCEFGFKIYRYQDKENEKFFVTFNTPGDTPLKGRLIKKECKVPIDLMTDYTQIDNYEFTLVIEAARGVEQSFESDFGGGIKEVYKFGHVAVMA